MKKYAVFIEGLRLTTGSLAVNVFFIARRIIFVASAIYATTPGTIFSAIVLYMITSQLKIMYLLRMKPYDQQLMNSSEIVNECFVLLMGYFALVLLDQGLTR